MPRYFVFSCTVFDYKADSCPHLTAPNLNFQDEEVLLTVHPCGAVHPAASRAESRENNVPAAPPPHVTKAKRAARSGCKKCWLRRGLAADGIVKN